MTRILLVEDDVTFAMILEQFLRKKGYDVLVRKDVKKSIEALHTGNFDLALLDYRLPDGLGTEVLAAAHAQNARLPVIIMTSFNDVKTAVQAIRAGAKDYITKPVNPDELLLLLKEVLHRKEEQPQFRPAELPAPVYVEGASEASRQLHEHIRLVAPTDMSVIIEGESGTGKENVARTIHLHSKRANAPFVAIDCGALSPELAGSELFGHVKGAFTGAATDKVGQFEFAEGGTLFLDEVGNLDYQIQVKLLRAIQERVIQPAGSVRQIKVNVRIITATNEDLVNAVKEGRFREDLYHRLNEFKIKVPALRMRSQDRDLFVDHFIQLANKELGRNIEGLSPEVKAVFNRYEWPGNLRELKNIVKRAVLLSKGTLITIDALPEEMRHVPDNMEEKAALPSDLKSLNARNEKELILRTLEEVKYNKSKAARLLNIDRTTLYSKMAKYGIE